MPKIVLTRKKAETLAGDMLVCCFEHDKKKRTVKSAGTVGKEMEIPLSHNDFYGKEKSSLLLYPDGHGKSTITCKRLLLAGLGQKSSKSRDDARERCRSCGGVIAVAAGKYKVKRLAVILPEMRGLKSEEVLECLVEGLLLGGYSFCKYKNNDKKSDAPAGIKEICIRIPDNGRNLRRSLSLGRNAAEAAMQARDMANEPGNGWTPASFAGFAQKLGKRYKMRCTVLEKKDMKAKKMGGLLGVNQGSAEAPKLVILEYHTSVKAETILLVGKGLTFDSGGISLKPGAGMQDMKYDMCGGAAVLSMMQAVGAEKPAVNVIAIVPSTDNMPGGSALKPGDIVRHYGGTTSEIINTDAEGRLILADALAYGIETFKPDCVVDLATLTGAVIVGLGHHRTGLLGNNQKLVDRLMAAGKTAGEPLWQLPLDEEYVKQIESDVADIKNTGGPAAGTITAAAYLQTFVGDTPWAHLDIAGTAWNFTKKTYIPKGPSGTGTRTLVELVRSWKKM